MARNWQNTPNNPPQDPIPAPPGTTLETPEDSHTPTRSSPPEVQRTRKRPRTLEQRIKRAQTPTHRDTRGKLKPPPHG
jgi:hypothetical protein